MHKRLRGGVLGALAFGAASVGRADGVGLSHRDRLYDVAEAGGTLFAVGHPGHLLASRDGGRSFQALSAGLHEEALFSVDFNAAGKGAVVGRSGAFLLSRDRGKTWRRGVVNVNDERPNLFGVEVLDDGALVAVGEFGVILRSSDDGATWQRSTFDAALYPAALLEAGCEVDGSVEAENADVVQEARLTDVRFADDVRGFVVGEFGLVLRSDDGGKSFARVPSCTDKTLYGLAIPAPGLALAVGAEGALIESRAEGRYFAALPSGTDENLYGVFADGRRAVAVGAAGAVVMKSGQGAFAPVPSGVHTWLTSAWLAAEGAGVVVGGRGSVLAVSDAGKTLTRVSGE